MASLLDQPSAMHNPSDGPRSSGSRSAEERGGSGDAFGRPLRNLRVSVTDRCNLRCGYCMPEKEYTWLRREELLTFEEMAELVDGFIAAGVRRVRLTGGEPLLRRDLATLVALLRTKPLHDIALTTNGLGLVEQAAELRQAGLDRVTISLDSLRRDRYRELTRRDALERALAGIEAARAAGFEGTKLNTVVMRGQNDDELVDILRFAQERGIEARFIEYMDVGGATRWTADAVVARDEILQRIGDVFGPVEPAGSPAAASSAPAQRFRLADGTRFGVIASTTAPFCGSCDRARVTADGRWFTCLYAARGLDLRQVLRNGASREELAALIGRHWAGRSDRGAEERLALADRGALADAAELGRDPHLEMHTRGG